MSKSIAERTIVSATWNVGASLASVVVLFLRSVILSRLLPVATFGTYGFASATVALTSVVLNFGLTGAFLHRTPETENESKAAATHFTIITIIALAWTIIMVLGALWFTSGNVRWAIIVLTIATAFAQLAQTPRVILIRRVAHRRLAIIQLISAIFTTVAAVTLAWWGVALWALLITNVINATITLVMLYGWRPVWRPQFRWAWPEIRYFLHFGSRTFLSSVLLSAQDRIDDLWTGFYLGSIPLGFYNRSYTFATYPRRILANPISTVTSGTFAELKHDKERLSQAFFRTTALLLRSGYFLGGLLALIAPEFIGILLGSKWLPMTDVFRLMLIFALLDPIKAVVANLFIAVGRPEQVIQARFVQLLVLFIGLFVLGSTWGIIGVALAVDAMLVVGIALLLWKAQAYVNLSLFRLFAAPVVALIVALSLSYTLLLLFGISETSLTSATMKSVIFIPSYLLLMLVMERTQTITILQQIITIIRR